MDVQYMTLDGRVEKDAFLDEWWNSDWNEATFLQTEEVIYLMPYGHFDRSLEPEKAKVKFEGSYRRHIFVRRDFEITDMILGGGYLVLSRDKTACKSGRDSDDFGAVRDRRAIILAVTETLLR